MRSGLNDMWIGDGNMRKYGILILAAILLLTACAPSRMVGEKEVVGIRFTSGAADAGQLEDWKMRTHIASGE